MGSQLPAHLQGRQQALVTRAADGMGGMVPPHISIKDNRFTFVDGAGNRRMHEQVYLDVVVADISDVMCKMFFKFDYEPGDNEPPTCWSSNGVGPSIDAIEPQAPTCAACPNNVRGSATGRTGTAIKACRDEKYLAVVAAPFPAMRWRLVLTPGSFKNWGPYTKMVADRGLDLPWLVTRLAFASQGVLTFTPLDDPAVGFTPLEILDAIEKERASGAYNVLAGRTDRPRQGVIAATQDPQRALPQAEGVTSAGFGGAPQSFQPSPAPAAGFGAAPTAGFPSTGTASVATAGPGQPSQGSAPAAASPSEPTRRKRRTRAEMEAARAGQPAPAAPAEVRAPFPTEGGPAAAVAGTFQAAGGAPAGFGVGQPVASGGFGITSGVAPNPELQAMLDKTFGAA